MKMPTFLFFTWIIMLLNLAGGQGHTPNTAKGEVQLRVFDNSSFDSAHHNFPIHLEENTIVYVEVEANNTDRVVIPKECHITAYKDSNHHPSFGYRLISEHCPRAYHCNYLPTNTRAVRFRFTFRQFFGLKEQFMFLHCKFTTCQSKTALRPTIFNCERQGLRCPKREESFISMGPFVVWPDAFKPDRQRLETESNVQAKVNSTTQTEVEVSFFQNDSFTLEHAGFPILAKAGKKLYVQVKATKNDRVVFPNECYVSASKNRTDDLRPSRRYTLIQYNCPIALDSDYLSTHNKAVRFKFTIRQFFGPKKQLLYLHCKMTTCQRKESPGMTVFSCLTQGQYCPQQQDSEMTMGPFVVLPTGLRRGKKSMKFKTGANNPGHGELEVGIFRNKTFNQSYNDFPIHLDMNSIVYVEVKATKSDRVVIPKECHVSAYKNCTDHHSSLGYLLFSDYCPVTVESDYLPTHVGKTAAVRFKFGIRQYFGISEQFLYLHCQMTSCQRNEAPYPHVFNCHTQAQHCPNQQNTGITVGPFVVWPVGFKQDERMSLEMKGAHPAEPTEQLAPSEFSNTEGTGKVCVTYFHLIAASLGSFAVGIIVMMSVRLIKWFNKRNKETPMEVQV